MNRNNIWKWLFVLFIVLWSLNELNPPSARNLIEEFNIHAEKTDTNFTTIVASAKELEKKFPERGYMNLVAAIGTNDIRPYFTKIKFSEEKDPTRAILNRIQKESGGKIRLGLDLQGGTSFLVSMDTNKLSSADEKGRVLSQAIEVLRKRVDRFGVSEPLIQPVGDDRILIQLPGLSEAEYQTA